MSSVPSTISVGISKASHRARSCGVPQSRLSSALMAALHSKFTPNPGVAIGSACSGARSRLTKSADHCSTQNSRSSASVRSRSRFRSRSSSQRARCSPMLRRRVPLVVRTSRRHVIDPGPGNVDDPGHTLGMGKRVPQRQLSAPRSCPAEPSAPVRSERGQRRDPRSSGQRSTVHVAAIAHTLVGPIDTRSPWPSATPPPRPSCPTAPGHRGRTSLARRHRTLRPRAEHHPPSTPPHPHRQSAVPVRVLGHRSSEDRYWMFAITCPFEPAGFSLRRDVNPQRDRRTPPSLFWAHPGVDRVPVIVRDGQEWTQTARCARRGRSVC